jgi:DNA primase
MSDRISQSTVDEVLARTNLRSVVEPYVELTRKGGRFWGRCPFHTEKTPSFSVSPEQGLFYCFGCQAGGSAIQFLTRIEGWSFRETIEELAKRAGVELELGPSREEDRKRRSERDRYFEILERATQFYEEQFHSGQHKAALDYMAGRGVDVETSRSFRLGYAPKSWDAVLRFMHRNKHSGAAVESAGLALPGKGGGGYYDRFRDRIMFPVINRMGRVVGFSGRLIESTERQKYINSPELAYFKKGEHLYGLDAAKPALRKSRRAIVVEGNFDVVTLHAKGFRTAVAPLGTALTSSQVNLLRRVSESAVLVFDGDEAGQKAMLRCLEPCYGAELPVYAVQLPREHDPDSFVRDQGAEAFEELLEKARPLAEVAIDQTIAGAAGGPPEERLRAARSALPLLRSVRDEGLQRAYLEQIAQRLDLPVSSLAGPRSRQTSEVQSSPNKPLPVRERQLVQVLWDLPRLASRLLETEGVIDLLRPEVAQFAELLSETWMDDGSQNSHLIEQLAEEARPLLYEAIAAAPREYDDADNPEGCFEQLIRPFRNELIRRAKNQLKEEIRTAELAGDDEHHLELLQRDLQLTRELKEIGWPIR